ncbi:MAG: alpha/beta hydrolase, partial [Kiloniellales bacterium]|nr:alpha/beta hydrolase [Kiloniellales bacterium]
MTKVFLHYDQAELDRQLNLRARWPDHGDYFSRWERNSKRAYGELPCKRDLAYGPEPSQVLDLFLPSHLAGSAAPLLFFVHGGYWQALDKSDFAFIAPAFLAKGIAFASVNYTLAPAARVKDIVLEVRRAWEWIGDHTQELGIDPARIVVCGHSAGGHLAAMIGL